MPHRHFILFKPYGYLSQFTGEKAKQKKLGELYAFPPGTMAIGRLDQASEGLLFLTTDGQESARIRERSVEKEYWVQVDGQITDEALDRIRTGVDIRLDDGSWYRTLPLEAQALSETPHLPERARRVRSDRHGPSSWIRLVLREGKFRQIRKMTAAVGFPTLRLVRVRIGDVTLGDLQPGEVREVGAFA
jgi:23S rRNA pseudouridine2457 synthase